MIARSASTLASVCLWLACSSARGAVFSDSVSADNGGITAWTDPGATGFGAGLVWGINAGQLQPQNYTVGIGHVWYQATASDTISPAFTATGVEFANSLTAYTGGSVSLGPAPFYLGFWLDLDGNSTAGSDDRYGWVKLQYDGADLLLLGNAITDSGSIQVGVVPEPSTCAIFAAASLALIGRRRRSRGSDGAS